MMNTDVRELMLAGAHFGHRARFWNPQMAPYIYGKYHSTHIINLDRTVEAMKQATAFLKSVTASGGKVLFVCTKNAAGDSLEGAATSANMPYVNRRWLGGILTNFKTTRNSVNTLKRIEEEIAGGVLKHLTKKEGMKLLLSKDKLEQAIGGIREMDKLPDALFIVDAGWHKGAVREANKLGIPVVAVVDTNHSPNGVDYVIPGNDDSRQAISIYTREMSLAVAEGKQIMDSNLAKDIRASRAAAADDDKPAVTDGLAEERTKRKTKIVVAKPSRKDGEAKGVVVEEVDKKLPARKLAVPVKKDTEKKTDEADEAAKEEVAVTAKAEKSVKSEEASEKSETAEASTAPEAAKESTPVEETPKDE